MICVKSVSKSFGDRQVLSDVSLDLRDGEIVGLYGDSGCGKSTLAKILCGVLTPDGGTLVIDGKTVFSETKKYDRAVGKQIQIVVQQPFSALDPSQKIGASLYEIAKYNRLASTRAERLTLVEKVASDMGLDKPIFKHTPAEISGGEAQRVAIAKCILLRPKLLILDEATSMLDVATQAEVLSVVKNIVMTENIAILFISHDQTLVQHFCDRIYANEDFHFREINK